VPTSRTGGLRRRENLEFYLFISPRLVGFVLFVAGPMLATLALSFTRWDLLTPPKRAGAANFVKLLTDDPLFWQALKVSGRCAETRSTRPWSIRYEEGDRWRW
jgi:ABC-type sugar transport system permease subunit